MKRKMTMLLLTMALTLTLIGSVSASWDIEVGVDGYVKCNEMPVEGIVVRVYNVTSGMLEGYGVKDDDSQGMLGTDTTDADGYFHIAWLYGYGVTYKVVAETPVGNITQSVPVYCTKTTQVNFTYCEPYTIGYWKNHPEAWPVTSLTIGDVTYNQTQLLDILWNAKAKDATSMLAAQLIAAKLNVANGAYSPSIEDTIDEADAFLTDHPLGSNPRGTDRSYALMLKDALDYFNNG